MEAKAVAKYIRMSPQKVRLVVDLIRGKKVQEASNILRYTRKYSAGIVAKVLKSAVANAAQNPNIDENTLYVKGNICGPGSGAEEMARQSPGQSGGNSQKNVTYHRCCG